jgi:hypothetical protein
MSAIAPLEDFVRIANELESLEMKNPEIYRDFVALFKNNRKVGYKNICKLLMKEATPHELKRTE